MILPGMISGGSGITPMMQVASQILSNGDDNTQASPLPFIRMQKKISNRSIAM